MGPGDFSAKRNRSVNDWWSKTRTQKREESWIYHVEGVVSYDLKIIDIDKKNYPTAPGRWKMISHHWVKEIDSDSSVNASSLWFNGKKRINFFATPATEGEFVCGGITQKYLEIVSMED